MHVIATAGHVDHGKSTLIRALTGINPDRLREEQQREMTIDLGFAWMTLPDGESIGIVDVPGHIDFIDNMLAGVGGVDAALLVIAADEGPMPQTREHLAILDLLQVERGVVALTKTDLAPDEDWVPLIEADVRALLAPTELAHAPIVPVSAREGDGLEPLIAALADVLRKAPPRHDVGRPRLPVDRAFTMTGFGTVVTGTLVDGALAIGDEVEVLTQRGERLPARVRGLQTHKHKLDRAQAGSRVAINLSGVDVSQVTRGSVVAKPSTLAPTTLVDVRVQIAPDPLGSDVRGASEMRRTFGLPHNAEVKMFSGAAQSIARAWLLNADALGPGQEGWAQLQLASPMVVANGDRFIVRLPSPSITIGGGTVVDAHPALRYRRRGGRADARVTKRLEALSLGTPEDRLMNALGDLKLTTREEAMHRAQLSPDEMSAAVAGLMARDVLIVSQDILGTQETWRDAFQRASALVRDYHQAQALSDGMPRDTLRSRLKLAAQVFGALLNVAGNRDKLYKLYGNTSPDGAPDALIDAGDYVHLASHQVQFTPQQQGAVDALMGQCRSQPWNTPSVKDARAVLGDDVYEALLRQKLLVQLGGDVILLPDSYEQAVRDVSAFIRHEGQMTAAQVRDYFGTTRKYALALMEHLDAIGVTKRMGDVRVLRGQ